MPQNTEYIYQLILSVLAEEATEKELSQLQEWLDESEANRLEFEQIKRLYHLSDVSQKRATEDFDVERAWIQMQNRIERKRKRVELRRWIPYAAASLVGVLFIAAGFYFTSKPIPEDLTAQKPLMQIKEPTLLMDNGQQLSLKQDSFLIHQSNVTIHNNSENLLSYEVKQKQTPKEKKCEWNRLVIPKGNAYELKLADGTRVWLNAESELSFPTTFSDNIREVKLKGEAYFDVAKNPNKPFIVRTEDIDVKVLGTSFNLSAYQSDPTTGVTLVEGSVAVSAKNGAQRQIVPSEQFNYNKLSGESSVNKVDTHLYTSWIQGNYIFKDATLQEIFSKLAHWYDFTVEYRDEHLKQKRYSLTMDRTISLSQLLELISYTSDVKLVQAGNNIIVEQKKEEMP